MSKLNTLHRQLGMLRRRRQWLRWGAAYTGAALALLWTLAGLFAIDWLFELDRAQRVLMLLVAAGVVAYTFRRYSLPWLGVVECEEEMALLVERQQHIDSDLVAALQFESPQARSWGSAQLETAVIDYVADFSKDLNVLEGIDTRAFQRRLHLLAATGLVLGVVAVILPMHLAVFFNRLALGSRHYPTRTQIEKIVINGAEVFSARDASLVATPKSPYWEPVKFEIHWSGQPPAEGHVGLRTFTSGSETSVRLQRAAQDSKVFTGQLDRLLDSIEYQVYLGDAWTDAAVVHVIPLPVVEVDLLVTPPDYAAETESASSAPGGTRQISVVEGSRVAVVLRSDKPLREATLTVGKTPYPLEQQPQPAALGAPPSGASELQPAKAGTATWRLDRDGTPLAQIAEPLKYEIQVLDTDGLRLKEPIQGFIRIKADRPPRVTAAIVTQHVLPTAKPKIEYGAADDYGVALLKLHRQVVRVDGGSMQNDTIELPASGTPPKVLRGQLPVDLADLRLVKGDQLKLTFEAVDYRGKLAGKSALSEPLVLHVTDERGVLAAMGEIDERSARQLDAIIQRQLGIGESQ